MYGTVSNWLRSLAIGGVEGANESIFEDLDSLLCSIAPVVLWLNQSDCDLLGGEVSFDVLGGLIVAHHIDYWFKSLAHQKFEVLFVCLPNVFGIETCNRGHQYCVYFVVVYVVVKQHVQEVIHAVVVHDAQYFVGKCAEAQDIGNGVILNLHNEIGGWLDM